MLKCKNDKTRTYKGTEPSPKGLGWCAHAEDPHTRKTGLDGNEWIVHEWSKTLNSKKIIKKWYKVTPEDSDDYVDTITDITKDDMKILTQKLSGSRKKLLDKLLTNVKDDLEEEGIKVIIAIWKPRGNIYYSSFFHSDIYDQAIRDYNGPYIIMTLKADVYGHMKIWNRKIYFDHELNLKRINSEEKTKISEKKAIKEIVNRIFKHHLGKKYEWDGKMNKSILIKI